MSLREPGKRIAYKSPGILPIEDEMAYTKNKCSERARKINSISPGLVFDVWFDQHLQIRQQFGDDNGGKTFTFINRELNGGRANRIVLQEPTTEGRLNVVIEAHLINIDTYEITVKTAMRNDSFMLSDGQFALEIFENESVLKRLERGKIREIYSYKIYFELRKAGVNFR